MLGPVTRALKILGPIIEAVAKYIGGGDRSPELDKLPSVLQSEIELARAEVRAEKRAARPVES